MVNQDYPDRVVVFMDYQNVHGWARRQFLPGASDLSAGHVDPLSLAELLVSRRSRPSELAEVPVYRGRPSPDRQPSAAAASDKQTERWERSDLVTAIRRSLMYPPDYPIARAMEKGIDVAIAVNMIRLGMAGYMDAAILFSSDTDLLPAVEMLWNLPQVHVEVAAWAGASRLRFSDSNAPWCHYLGKEDFEIVRDHQDYTR